MLGVADLLSETMRLHGAQKTKKNRTGGFRTDHFTTDAPAKRNELGGLGGR